MEWGDNLGKIKTLNFEKRDFLYDNGLVNIFLAMLRDKYRFNQISDYHVRYKDADIKLEDLKLQISGDIEEIMEIYFILRSIYYSKVFEETNNYKPYYDPEEDRVIIGPVLNVKPFLQRSERTKDLLPKITVEDNKLDKLKLEEETAKENFEGRVTSKLQYGTKNKVNIYLGPESLGQNISKTIKNLIKGDNCFFCDCDLTKYENSDGKKKNFVIASNNLVFDFGTGDPKPSFRDSRTKKDIPICYLCDIIYRFGLMKNYFVDNNVFIISGPSLKLILKYKLSLPNLDDNYIEVENKSKTNFLDKGYFIATGMNSRLLALLYLVYSKIIDEDELSLLSVYYFIVTGRGIKELYVYNKLSFLSKLFKETKYLQIINKNSFKMLFLFQLMNYAYYKDISTFETKNLPREKLANEILNALPIDFTLFDLSYYNLSSDSPSGLKPILLYKFLEKYLEVTGMVDLKELHEICMLVGDRIGYFAANTDNKSLLYELREIGNLENLTEFFRDLEYAILKEDAGAIWNSKPEGKEEKYSDFIHKLLLNVQSNKDTALVRNYLGIYAVQKYMSTKYAKSKRGD